MTVETGESAGTAGTGEGDVTAVTDESVGTAGTGERGHGAAEDAALIAEGPAPGGALLLRLRRHRHPQASSGDLPPHRRPLLLEGGSGSLRSEKTTTGRAGAPTQWIQLV